MPRKVLIIEDEDTLRMAYVIKLRREGFDPIEASNGQQGLDLAVVHAPDVILLDMLLGQIHGLEVLKALKTDPATAHIPVIVLTNLSAPVDAKIALDLGAAAYHVKAHVTMEAVVTEIDRHTTGNG